VVEAHWTAKHAGLNAFISCQNEYSVLVRAIERELLPAMQACGLGLLPYFPLAAGLLTGKYRRDAPFPADARLRHNKRWATKFLTDRNWAQLDVSKRSAPRAAAACWAIRLAARAAAVASVIAERQTQQ
jgi:aryl-alcohol dehydrogenase-like predicted oxidoreductase